MKRIDLHTHAKLSKTFPFTVRTVHQFIAQARRLNLDGLALLEHMHAPGFWDLHVDLAREFSYRPDAGIYEGPDGFRILTAAELSVAEGCDLVVLASLDLLRCLDGWLREPATSGYRPTFDEAMAAAHDAGAFVIGAHMFRPGKELAKAGRSKLGALDAVELNGEDFFSEERVRASADRLGLPVVGGSDAHFWAQVGIRATVLPIDEITQAAVADAVRERHDMVESQSYGPIAVQISDGYKRLAKARRARAEAAARYAPAAVGVTMSEAAGVAR